MTLIKLPNPPKALYCV